MHFGDGSVVMYLSYLPIYQYSNMAQRLSEIFKLLVIVIIIIIIIYYYYYFYFFFFCKYLRMHGLKVVNITEFLILYP